MGVRYGRNGQRLRESHEKSMWRYNQHAWNNAIELAQFLCLAAEESGWQLEDLRRHFETIEGAKLADFDEANIEHVAHFVAETPSRRPKLYRKWFAERPQPGLVFLILCILACSRAKELIDLRDDFREALAPGRGYRATVADLHAFGIKTALIYADYSWPYEVFEAIAVFTGPDDEDEESEDEEIEPDS